MANYNSLKNAALIAPTTTPDLGSDTNRYGNVFLSGNVNIAGTSITSTNVIVPKVSSISYIGDDTATDIAGGQTITLNGTGFADGASILIAGTVVSVVAFVNSTQLTFVSPAMTTGSYVLYVINPDGGTALSIPGIQYSGVPAWSTAAGTLGISMQGTSVSLTVAATGDAPVTYSVYSGTLPSGVTLNTGTGFISGTAPSVSVNTTYNFVIRASDAQKQDTNRSFSLTINSSNPTPTVEYLVLAGGGGGGDIGGGGAGGYRTGTGLAVSSGSAITVTVGTGGAGGTSAGGTSGIDSVFSTITSTGGGGGGGVGIPGNGKSGGSGGGAGVYAGGAYPSGTIGAGNTPVTSPSQGFSGGLSPGGGSGGGGGGGAGRLGYDGAGAGAAGGSGATSTISGTSTVYAGGGGGSQGGTGGGSGSGGVGGTGGGAAGAGAANRGGGGGAGWYGNGIIGGAGGSGIVILRYADTFDAATATTGSPTITVGGGYRVYKFTSSGSITF